MRNLIIAFAVFASPALSADLFIPDFGTDSDVYMVCVDKHGYRVFFENGDTWSPGLNTTSLDEIFRRSSSNGDGRYVAVSLLNPDQVSDCSVDIEEIEWS